MKQYCLKFHAVGEWLCVSKLKCLSAMCSAISFRPSGMVQPITVVELETFVMTNKYGAHLPFIDMLFFSLKEYEIITLIYKI